MINCLFSEEKIFHFIKYKDDLREVYAVHTVHLLVEYTYVTIRFESHSLIKTDMCMQHGI